MDFKIDPEEGDIEFGETLLGKIRVLKGEPAELFLTISGWTIHFDQSDLPDFLRALATAIEGYESQQDEALERKKAEEEAEREGAEEQDEGNSDPGDEKGTENDLPSDAPSDSGDLNGSRGNDNSTDTHTDNNTGTGDVWDPAEDDLDEMTFMSRLRALSGDLDSS